MGQRIDVPVILAEQEEFEFRPGIEGIAELRDPVELAHQHRARVSHKEVAVRIVHPADDPRGGVAPSLPRDHGKGRQIRLQEHIALGNPSESRDRGAVKPLAMLDHVREDIERDRDALDNPHHIGELEIDELNTLFFRAGHDFLDRRLPPDTWEKIQYQCRASSLVVRTFRTSDSRHWKTTARDESSAMCFGPNSWRIICAVSTILRQEKIGRNHQRCLGTGAGVSAAVAGRAPPHRRPRGGSRRR